MAHLKDKGNFEHVPHLDRTGRRSDLRDVGVVYYLHSEGSGRVKIGWSSNLAKRLKSLQLASAARLTVLFSEPGTGDDERALHRKFRHLNVHGEWFEGSQELLAHIEERRASPRTEWMPASDGPSKAPAPLITRDVARAFQEERREMSQILKDDPDYWEYGHPGWERLKRASKSLE